MYFKLFLILLLIIYPGIKGIHAQENRSTEETLPTPDTDTLYVGYTYWWPESGPFVGLCGTPYALAFTGIVKQLDATEKASNGIYNSRYGVIEIKELLKVDGVGKDVYRNQRFFASDCFENTGARVGELVLVFCYEYEDGISIPGGRSILRLDGLSDPLLESIKKFIAADQNPEAIAADFKLWESSGFGGMLEEMIECRRRVKEG